MCNGLHLPRSSSSTWDWIKPLAVSGEVLRARGTTGVLLLPRRTVGPGWGRGPRSRMILDSADISLAFKLFSEEVKREPVITLLKGALRGAGDTRSSGMSSLGGCAFLGKKEAERLKGFPCGRWQLKLGVLTRKTYRTVLMRRPHEPDAVLGVIQSKPRQGVALHAPIFY